MVNFIYENNSKWKIPLKITNFNGEVAENLVAHLLKDGVLTLFDIGDIDTIELHGDMVTGMNDNGELGGDIVVSTSKGNFIIEVKSFTTRTGYTNKSINNAMADFWVLCDFRAFRKGADDVKISIIKNFNKYANIQFIKANGESKIKLTELIDAVSRIGKDDYMKVKDIHLSNYLTTTDNPTVAAHSNGYWQW